MSKKNYLIVSILLIFLIIIIHSCIISKDNPFSGNDQGESGEGLCLYPTEVEVTSDLTYQNFDIETAPLKGDPVIWYNDIISYDTTSHILLLTFSRDSLKKRIGQIGVYGKPFLITLDAAKMYGGWFWTPISSLPCHWVVIEPDCLFDSLATNEIRIKCGYPTEEHFKGVDPRNNEKIFNRLIKDGKAK